MGLIFTFFFFVGAVAILFLAAPLALLFVGYELAFDCRFRVDESCAGAPWRK